MRVLPLLLLASLGCDRRFVEVPASVEWIGWIAVDGDAIASSSPLLPASDPHVWAVDDEVVFVGFEALAAPITPEGPLRAAGSCESRLRPAWSTGATPPLTIDAVSTRCDAGLDFAPCGRCTCPLEIGAPQELAIPDVATSLIPHGVTMTEAGTLIGTLRRDELAQDPIGYVFTATITGGLIASARRVDAVSRSIAFANHRAVIGQGADVVMLDPSGREVDRVSPAWPFGTPGELEVAGNTEAGVFAFIYQLQFLQVHAGMVMIDPTASAYDIVVDSSGSFAILGDPEIERCKWNEACVIVANTPDEAMRELGAGHRARIGNIGGTIYFAIQNGPLRRWEANEQRWSELDWPREGTEAKAIRGFAGGVLVVGHSGEGGIVYFERGAERCAMPLSDAINDVVVAPDGSRAYAVGGGNVRDIVVEISVP